MAATRPGLRRAVPRAARDGHSVPEGILFRFTRHRGPRVRMAGRSGSRRVDGERVPVGLVGRVSVGRPLPARRRGAAVTLRSELNSRFDGESAHGADQGTFGTLTYIAPI
jgi:hypothetical protein